MSLSDLKKAKDDKKKKKAFTVDEFIADAENYAKGAPELVSRGKNQPVDLRQALAAAKQFEVKRQAERRKSKEGKQYLSFPTY